MNIWFTADTHFFHTGILTACRSQFSTIDEMNEKLIDNWNEVVSNKDVVYHLGDFGFIYGKRNIQQMEKVFNRLNGNKNLCIGNHDCKVIKSFKWNNVFERKTIKNNGIKYTLNHFSQRSWSCSFHDSRHLFAHSHGNLKPYGYSCDVGVDSWNYAPVNIDTLEELFSTFVIEKETPVLWKGYEHIKNKGELK